MVYILLLWHFFELLEKLFIFFSSYTSCWKVLKSFIFRTVKRQCQTRWSFRYDGVKVMYEELDKVFAIHDHLLEGDYSRDTKSNAGALLHSISTISFYIFIKFLVSNFKISGKSFKASAGSENGV